MGTKRIGHGLQLFLVPGLVDELVRKDICVEVCPLSNYLQGHNKDLRSHPLSYLINKGVQISISSDDPGFFGYDGVSLDYTYAAGAWNLELRDLKKISLNGIKYSSLQDSEKDALMKHFESEWQKWINFINEIPAQGSS